jgi:hypothetical protein
MAAASWRIAVVAMAVAALAPAARAVHRSEFPPGFLFGAATSAYQVRVCAAGPFLMDHLDARALAVSMVRVLIASPALSPLRKNRSRAPTWRTARASATGTSSPTRTVSHLLLLLLLCEAVNSSHHCLIEETA